MDLLADGVGSNMWIRLPYATAILPVSRVQSRLRMIELENLLPDMICTRSKLEARITKFPPEPYALRNEQK